MENIAFANDAKVMAKGQVTIPKNIRKILGVQEGNRVTFVVEGNTVRIVNSFVYALEQLQKEMKEYHGKFSEEEIMSWVKEMRGQYEPPDNTPKVSEPKIKYGKSKK